MVGKARFDRPLCSGRTGNLVCAERHQTLFRRLRNGVKTGVETWWNQEGKKISEWVYGPDGTAVWTQYWPNGKRKHESRWKDGRCEGEATAWDYQGRISGRYQFKNGELVP